MSYGDMPVGQQAIDGWILDELHPNGSNASERYHIAANCPSHEIHEWGNRIMGSRVRSGIVCVPVWARVWCVLWRRETSRRELGSQCYGGPAFHEIP